MPRRRYRLFAVAAVVIVFLLYRVAQNSLEEERANGNVPPQSFQADDSRQAVPAKFEPEADIVAADDKTVADVSHSQPEQQPIPLHDPQSGAGLEQHSQEGNAHDAGSSTSYDTLEDERLEAPSIPQLKPEIPGGDEHAFPVQTESPTVTDDQHAAPTPAPTATDPSTPDHSLEWKDPPGNQNHKGWMSKPRSKIHWKPVTEHFPIPTDSIVPLPTGKPKPIPKIQYDFGPEAEDDKAERLQRRDRVKEELERSWTGYRKSAWMHDELSPVSGLFRDPFCGWAATLVDTLDTLWITGMREQFDEAANAVKDIDFTYSTRQDIPVFETTIRYLGGLLAAYDVSGGHEGEYHMLLEKAIELAEILMGIFDTPNRMPVMYYRWKPDAASQPHRATTANIAELASLSMEFTRLAQLTGKDKYYDAVDRITDALIEFQEANRSTIPGLFPQDLDVSGCNKTKNSATQGAKKPGAQNQVGAMRDLPDPPSYAPAQGAAAAAAAHGKADDDKFDVWSPVSDDDRIGRDVASAEADTEEGNRDVGVAPRHTISKRRPPPGADGKPVAMDCKPQGLVTRRQGYEEFHMGGAQDSAYEYFPKQYLLLGGLESKYQKLHEDAIDAVDEHLLYRPMIKDEGWDILFPAKLTTSSATKPLLKPEYEISHLTCFIGGMYGLGGKAFGRDADVETAKKLTDGCVWAYQSTLSGIMPESAEILPCDSLERCEFNETRWWDSLDPNKEFREREMQVYLAKEEERRLAKQGLDPVNGAPGDPQSQDGDSSALRKRAAIPGTAVEIDIEGSELPDSLKQKLGLPVEDNHEKGAESDGRDGTESTAKSSSKASSSQTGTAEGKTSSGGSTRASSKKEPKNQKPFTHEEVVQSKIKSSQLPPGFTSIRGRSYILRPEAIESVWYMYRITGDRTWQDKGWAMFQAIAKATRAPYGNSAISNVLDDPSAESEAAGTARNGPSSGKRRLKNEMESFWTAETLKYFYLLFSEPSLVSLDEWVLNTEAHPFRRPT